MATGEPLIRAMLEIAQCRAGVYRVSIPRLAEEMNENPFTVVQMLQTLQFEEKLTYEFDIECYCIQILRIVKKVPEYGQRLFEIN